MVEVAVRSTQQAQDFRRCHALPSLVAQFTSKPSDLCLLGSSGKLERAWLFGALRRFSFGVLRRRPLSVRRLTLERLFIAFPVGRGAS